MPGCSGRIGETPTAARVCSQECCSADIRYQSKHLKPNASKAKLSNISSKCRNLPDINYGGVSTKYISPDNFPSHEDGQDYYLDPGEHAAKMWEWCSGSATPSTYLREQRVAHLPPIDYRYGLNLSRHEHQCKLLDVQITVGVDSIFEASSCLPWGNNSRATPKQLHGGRRADETPTLQFLAVACFFQILSDRNYIAEKHCLFRHSTREPPPVAENYGLSFSTTGTMWLWRTI